MKASTKTLIITGIVALLAVFAVYFYAANSERVSPESTQVKSENSFSAALEKAKNMESLSQQVQASNLHLEMLAYNAQMEKELVELAESGQEMATVAETFRNRYKECDKGKVVKRPGSFTIGMDGVDVSLRDQKVVAVKGLNASTKTLDAITEKFAMLDDMLYQTCLDLAKEYDQEPRDKEIIMYLLDKRYALMQKWADIVYEIKISVDSKATDQQVKQKVDSVKISRDSIEKMQDTSSRTKKDTTHVKPDSAAKPK